MTVEQLQASLRLWENRERRAHINHLAANRRGDEAWERTWIDGEREAERMIARRREQLDKAGRAWKPRMVTASQAGLRFSWVFGSKGTPWRIAGHYTAGHRSANGAELLAEMKRDHAAHVRNGWGGLSYDYLIADDGTLGLGNPIRRKGAHVALNNSGNVGIVCPGTLGDRGTAAQARTLRWLLENAHTRALPRAHRSSVSLAGLPLKGHKQFPNNATACPDKYLPMYASKGKKR